jgi:hypothetical protein
VFWDSRAALSIVWGKSPTVDGYTAADGILFVDLTGFSSNSLNGALQQTVATTGGVTYGFTMDVASINNGVVLATIGSHAVVLSPGAPFVVAGTSWTPMTGTFVGDPLESAPLLKVMNGTPGADIVFIDNISLTGPAQTSVPQPGVLVLLLSGGALMSLMRWRGRRPSAWRRRRGRLLRHRLLGRPASEDGRLRHGDGPRVRLRLTRAVPPI